MSDNDFLSRKPACNSEHAGCDPFQNFVQAHAENYSQDADEDWARVGYQSVAHPEEGRPDLEKVRCMLICSPVSMKLLYTLKLNALGLEQFAT